VFDAALRESLAKGHDRDALQAFDRLYRELRRVGASDELRALCSRLTSSLKALRLPALIVRLESELDERLPFADTLELVLHASRASESDEDGQQEVAGLAEVYPELREALATLPAAAGAPELAAEPDFAGRRIVVFGGHAWLQKHALPVLKRWHVDVEWLDPESAKHGKQALSLADGNASLVVINTRCIGHAASGRVEEAARGLGVVYQGSRGVGSMLSAIRSALARLDAPQETKRKTTKAHEWRNKLR
jgi:hypothetical protein